MWPSSGYDSCVLIAPPQLIGTSRSLEPVHASRNPLNFETTSPAHSAKHFLHSVYASVESGTCAAQAGPQPFNADCTLWWPLPSRPATNKNTGRLPRGAARASRRSMVLVGDVVFAASAKGGTTARQVMSR